MFKYIRAVASMFFYIIWAYFAWMVPYSRHPERYPLSLRYARARAIAIKATQALHIDLLVENPEILKQDGPFLFISNHYSMYDGLIMVVLSEKPLVFVGKNEILKQPFFGRIMKTIGCVFIERDNLKQEIVALRKVKDSLVNKESSWVIYPEGTRNRDFNAPLLPFKAGTFKMAIDTKTTIVPVATFGNFRPLNTKFHFRRYPIQIRFLKPITPEEYEGKNTIVISSLVSGILQTQIDQLRKKDKDLVSKFK